MLNHFFITMCIIQNRIRSTSNPQIHVISTSQTSVLVQNLKSMAVSHFFKSTSKKLLTYSLTLTNKSAIDLRIWKECRIGNTLKSDRDLR